MPVPSPEPRFASREDLKACRAILEGGSRTFTLASRLLPRRVHEPAAAVYAFCREADDAIDCGGGQAAALEELRDRLARVYDGRPRPTAVDRALADVVARFDLPRALPLALLDGLAWDAERRRYDSLADLEAYAARVAGTVGAMMAILMGARTPGVIARACELGVAMQLSNVARDVGEDARAGRIYLPLDWMREAGLDPDGWLAAPVPSAALGSVVQRLLRRADAVYGHAAAGIAHLPLGCRPGIHAARFLYAGIGREVERAGLDSVTRRAVVSPGRKIAACARALLALGARRRQALEPALAEVQFLVDALPRSAEVGATRRPWRSFDEQAAWLIALFERLDRQEHAGR